jgi:hypothetical protein
MKRRLLAVPLGLLLALWTVGSALATTPEGTVTVDTDGCDFTVNISLPDKPAVVGWVVKEFRNGNWFKGDTLLSGSGAPDADGNLTVGPNTLPEGHYTVGVDDETPVDNSAIVTEFTLSCPASSESPSGSVTPSDSEQPANGSPSPTGDTLPAQGTPGNVTPPPTDSGPMAAGSDDAGARLALMGLAGLIVGSLFAARAARPSARVRRRDDT